MKKLLLLLSAASCFSQVCCTTYHLLPSSSDDKIIVEEITMRPIHGYSSSGESITLYQEHIKERQLELLDAYDIGIHHQQTDILCAALTKLQKKGQTVDITCALDVLYDSLLGERSHKHLHYILGGIFSACAIVPWLGSRTSLEQTLMPCGGCYYVPAWRAHTSSNTECFIASAVCVAIGGGIALYNHWCFKQASKKTIEVLSIIKNSGIAVMSDKQKARASLSRLRSLLCDCDKSFIDTFLQPHGTYRAYDNN
jgi:hypothetical protein